MERETTQVDILSVIKIDNKKNHPIVCYIGNNSTMNSYFLSEGGGFLNIRCRELTSTASLHFHWENLTSHKTGSFQITPQAYDEDESILEFTYVINEASASAQYRVTLTSGSTQIWHGETEVFLSSSIKSVYESKNNQYIPHTSNNEFIIYQ